MSGTRKANVFAGRTIGRNSATGVFSSVTGPGLGKASNMDRTVFEKAVHSANETLRRITAATSSGIDGRYE